MSFFDWITAFAGIAETSDTLSNSSMKPASFSALRDTQLTRRSSAISTMQPSLISKDALLHIFAFTEMRSDEMSC